jgi:hypothetical protein
MSSTPTRPAPASPRSRPRARAGALLVVAALVLAGGCSSDDGSDGRDGADTTRPAGATTTSKAPVTTEAGSSTTLGATTNTTAPAQDDPANADYRGKVDGRDATVTFTRKDGTILDLAISSLTLDCLPTGDGEPTTRKATVSIDRLPLPASGVVEVTAKDDPYSPSITGTFAEDGTFSATVLFSGQREGYACGGEFPFTAQPR